MEGRRKANLESGYTLYSVNSKPEITLGIVVLGNKTQPADSLFDYCNTREDLSFTVKHAPSKAALSAGMAAITRVMSLRTPAETSSIDWPVIQGV
ncbi:MAG TPA: hypothetical protein VIN38_07620 [Thiobacillus sp.]